MYLLLTVSGLAMSMHSIEQTAAMDTAMLSRSCISEVGVAVGVIIVAGCVIVTVITVIVVLCLWK